MNTEPELDDVAFKKFFQDYFVRLCAYCQFKFGFDTDLAKDTVQTGFLKLWEARKTIQPGSSPRAYLYKVVSNLCLDIVKHKKIEQTVGKTILRQKERISDTGLENTDFRQLKAALDQAVAELPEQMRKVFELCRYEGMKYAEIARTLGISIKTVETQMSRAMSKLRQKLSEHLSYLVLLSLAINKISQVVGVMFYSIVS